MTTYTENGNLLNALTADWFQQNPQAPPLVDRLGRVTLSSKINANSRYVDYDMLLSTGEVLASDEFNNLGGSSTISKAGLAKTKLFDWKIQLPRREFLETVQAGSSAQVRLQELLKANAGAYYKKIDGWVTTGPTIATDIDYDPEWRSPLAAKAATGTINTPQDMNDTPGTAQNKSTTNFTGAGITINAIESTFGTDIQAFGNKVDTYSDRTLLRNDGSDRFTAFVNPAFKILLDTTSTYIGSGIYGTQTFAQKLAAMGVDLYPTNRLTWTGLTDATTNYVLVPNISENIFFAWLPGAQYRVDPWDETYEQASLRGWGIGVAFAKPWSFDAGTTIEKAVRITTVTPSGA
jgi:hypothetical protein